jgi:hypothetical protein
MALFPKLFFGENILKIITSVPGLADEGHRGEAVDHGEPGENGDRGAQVDEACIGRDVATHGVCSLVFMTWKYDLN